MIPDDPAIRRIRARHNDIPQDPLFDIDNKVTAEPTKRAPAAKAVRQQQCPECKREKVGVIRVTDEVFQPHFVLRDHTKRTYGGHTFKCPGSGMEMGEHLPL